MLKTIQFFLWQVIFVFLLSACASTPSDFDDPEVSVVSFKPQNSAGLTPNFEIILQITNPNREPLEIEGMSYSISLAGNKVMSGVANDLPTIEPYDKAEVTLNATADLFGSIKLLTGLMENKNKNKNIEYEFKAKIDVGVFRPSIRVVKQGTLSN